jgi:glycosyltransferase involved in cell wall biosynthesis
MGPALFAAANQRRAAAIVAHLMASTTPITVARPLTMSVITVCYNSVATIARTLESVAKQTWPEVEHIVVDGASSDATLSVIAANNVRVTALVSERDSGVYDAMNKGVGLATGDVVAFLNADDFYKDMDVLKRVAQVMADENLDALYGDVEFFRLGQQNKVVRRYNSGQFTPDRLSWGWMPAHPALFVRRELFDRYGLFRPDYRIAGDFEFIARVFKHRELRHRYLRQSLVRMQMGGLSTSGWQATLLLNREMMRACQANSIPTNWLKMLARYPLKLMEFARA